MASNRIKGITIEIGGDTSNLKKSLKGVDSSLKQTEARLKDVNKLLKLDPKNTELLRQKNELLSKAVEDTNKKLAEEKIALEQLKAGEQTEKTIQQQKDLEREIIATTQSLEGYKKQLKQTEVSLEDVGKVAENVANKTKGLSTAAAALGTALIGNAYAAGLAADDLNTLSKQTGFSVEELQKMQYASDLIDVSMDSMTGSIKKLTKQMSSGSKAFETLGVEVYDSNGSMRDAVTVWYESLEALSQVSNETERDALAMEIFGKSAADLSGIVDDGGQALKEMGAEAEDLGLILSQDSVDAANEFNDAVDRMKARSSAAFFEMGASLADTLVPAIEGLLDVVTKVVTWFGNLDGASQTIILVMAGLIASIAPLATTIATVINTVTTLHTALEALSIPKGPIGLTVAAIAAAIAIGVLLYKNWDTIKAKAGELWDNISTTFENIKNTIKDKIEAAKNFVHDAIEKIKSFFKFDWSLPPIKLPHFKTSGSFSWSLTKGLTLPSISVDWYKKAMQNGMILNSPTIFGYQNGRLLGAGEAGSETVVGTNSLMNMIQNAVGSGMTVNMTVNGSGVSANELADIVIDKLTAKIQRNTNRW